ncbi:MAG: HAD-IB family hydrolase [Candidatus Omnitrophica bacterium]|nr:HAD-IB family hydrolase [Candidatus Omnitrophota bacterium]
MSAVVFFDVDGVLIKGQTQKFLMSYLLKHKKIPLFLFFIVNCWFILYKIGLIKDVFEIRKIVYQYFKGWDVIKTKEIFKDFFEEEIKPKVNMLVVDIMRGHIKKGEKIVLLSASLREIIDMLKEYLGLEYAISTELEVKNNKYTGNIAGLVPYGKYKIIKISQFLQDNKFSLRHSWAYSDHISDLELLQIVENSCVVNPDRKLRHIAIKNGWRIYDFE